MTTEAERLSRVEGFLEQMDRRLTRVEADIADLRQEMASLRQEVHEEIGSLRQEMRTQFYWLVGLMVTVLAGLVGLAASIIATGR